MLYHLWRDKGIYPSDFYSRSKGEQLILRAFYEYELEERNRILSNTELKIMPIMDVLK